MNPVEDEQVARQSTFSQTFSTSQDYHKKKQRPYYSLRNQTPHSETNLSVFLCERNIPQRSVTSLRIPATSQSQVTAENYERCSLRCSRKKSTPHHGLSARSSTLCDANDVSQKKVVLYFLSVFFRSQSVVSYLLQLHARPSAACKNGARQSRRCSCARTCFE